MGGGGGGYIPPASSELQRKIEAAQKAERERLGEEVNKYLGNLLAKFNDRDVDRTQERLKAVSQTLSEGTEVETLLFGGSVAKHTYVDGLSDVDALVVLQKGGADDRSANKYWMPFIGIFMTSSRVETLTIYARERWLSQFRFEMARSYNSCQRSGPGAL